jgi:hypothetical protein
MQQHGDLDGHPEDAQHYRHGEDGLGYCLPPVISTVFDLAQHANVTQG